MPHPLASGIIAAAILPFREDGAIDWPTLATYLDGVVQGRPRAIAMNMAMSEVSSLEPAEQLEVIRRTKASLAGGCMLLSGLSVTHTAAAKDFAVQLVDAGAEGLVIFPPVPAFVGGVTIPMIEDFHGAIASVVKVPLLAFQSPLVNYPTGAITALSKIPGIVAIKDATFNMDHTIANIKESAAAPRKIGVLTGSDTFILEAMLMGCDGALIGFAATATAELVRMHDLVTQKKVTEAYDIWDDLGPLARICWRAPLRDYRVRTKYALMRQGVIPNIKVRAPFPGLAPVDKAEIDSAFAKFDLGNPRFLPAGKAAKAAVPTAARTGAAVK